MGTFTCANSGCGNVITLSDGQETRLRQTHAEFYCPMGHTNWFPGKTDAQRVKELETALQDARMRSEQATRWRDDVISANQYSIRTLRGHLTRLKRKAGLAPPKEKRRGHAR